MHRGLAFIAFVWMLGASSLRAETGALERLTLDQAVERALQRNPNVLTAAAEVRRAEGLVIQARAGALPTIQPQVTNTLLNKEWEARGFLIRPHNQVIASVPVTIPLVAPQAWARWAHAVDNRRVAELDVATVRRNVAIAVANAYLAVVVARRTIEIENTAVDNARAHADYTQQQFEAGTGTQLDAVRAAQQLHTAEALRRRALQSLVSAQEALGVLVAGESPVDAAETPVFPLPSSQEELTRRPDIEGQEMRKVAATHQVRDNYVEYLPQLVASFDPVYTQPPVFGTPRWYWQLQVSVVLPLYDGGVRYGLARQRHALLSEANFSLENALRTARADVRAGFAAVAHAEATVREAREAATLAQKALQIAELRYREGATTNIEVIDAEQQARNADLVAAQAEDNLRQVRLNLLSASGVFPKSD